MYSGAMLIDSLQRKEVSHNGFLIASVAPGGATSSVVRSVALWVRAPVGVVHSLLKAFCFRCRFILASAVLL